MAELAQTHLEGDRLDARGVALRMGPPLYRLDYELETGPRFITARFEITARGATWMRSLDLRRSRSGVWAETWKHEGDLELGSRAASDLEGLAEALDVDLGLSPLLNTPPVLRHHLHRSAGSVDFVMAWVSVPDLTVHRSPQRYTFVGPLDGGRSVVRFESLAADGFKADVTYDAAGFVIDYPGIGKRVT